MDEVPRSLDSCVPDHGRIHSHSQSTKCHGTFCHFHTIFTYSYSYSYCTGRRGWPGAVSTRYEYSRARYRYSTAGATSPSAGGGGQHATWC